ncbi:uncharacterized protein BJX67DRAFT_31335 [Aspergillus lucknowensis]|uniref:Uncharacterized protein n=1 Tax=Aspergillus lucknowensis TaxID=176173 RepID=A0ABR4LX80_9EURO
MRRRINNAPTVIRRFARINEGPFIERIRQCFPQRFRPCQELRPWILQAAGGLIGSQCLPSRGGGRDRPYKARRNWEGDRKTSQEYLLGLQSRTNRTIRRGSPNVGYVILGSSAMHVPIRCG